MKRLTGLRSITLRLAWLASLSPIVLLGAVRIAIAAEFFCQSGNVTCLIAAINASNQNGQRNTINLEVGQYMLTTVDNITDGANGLPSITGKITIQGPEGTGSTIERDPGAASFRLFHVVTTGILNLKWLGLRGGDLGSSPCEDAGSRNCSSGSAILSRGNVSIFRNAIYNNTALGISDGGAIFSIQGSLTISQTDIRDNDFPDQSVGGGISSLMGPLLIEDSFIFQNGSDIGGGIFTGGDAIIRRTTIFSNKTRRGFGAGIRNDGQLTIENSTIDRNVSGSGTNGGGGIFNRGNLTLVSSTVSRNVVNQSGTGPGAGIYNTGTAFILNSTITQNNNNDGGIGGLKNDGNATLQNTILGGNTSSNFFGNISPSDCNSATSVGNNIIGDPTGCSIDLQATDLTGDPGLAEYTEDLSTAGSGRYPLFASSHAIDSASPAGCPKTDQLSLPRRGTCDIGSVEFQTRMLVPIDIRPQSDANKINPNSINLINVAILSGNDFDATTVAPNTVRFGATGTEAAPINIALRDVDGDRHRDMVLQFAIPDTGINCGDSSASLMGQTSTGVFFIGSNPITTVQCKKRNRINR